METDQKKSLSSVCPLTTEGRDPSQLSERSSYLGNSPQQWNPAAKIPAVSPVQPSSTALAPGGSCPTPTTRPLASLSLPLRRTHVHFQDSKANDKEFCFWNYFSRSWTPFWSYQNTPSTLPPSRRFFRWYSPTLNLLRTLDLEKSFLGHSRPGGISPPQPDPSE